MDNVGFLILVMAFCNVSLSMPFGEQHNGQSLDRPQEKIDGGLARRSSAVARSESIKKYLDKSAKLLAKLKRENAMKRICFAMKWEDAIKCYDGVIACSFERFGANCSEVCKCNFNYSFCHPVSGECMCLPVKTGEDCSQEQNNAESLLEAKREESDYDSAENRAIVEKWANQWVAKWERDDAIKYVGATALPRDQTQSTSPPEPFSTTRYVDQAPTDGENRGATKPTATEDGMVQQQSRDPSSEFNRPLEHTVALLHAEMNTQSRLLLKIRQEIRQLAKRLEDKSKEN